jgi:hypothetical protein
MLARGAVDGDVGEEAVQTVEVRDPVFSGRERAVDMWAPVVRADVASMRGDGLVRAVEREGLVGGQRGCGLGRNGDCIALVEMMVGNSASMSIVIVLPSSAKCLLILSSTRTSSGRHSRWRRAKMASRVPLF